MPQPKLQRESKHHYLVRSLPLLFLILYATVSVLKLGSPPSSSSSSSSASSSSTSSSSAHQSDSFFVEKRRDLDPLKTHISTDTQLLQVGGEEERSTPSIQCSALIDGVTSSRADDNTTLICCDRSHYRTDVCYIKGDIRTDPAMRNTVLVYGRSQNDEAKPVTIRPYTRKWETSVMGTIDEISIRPRNNASHPRCDVEHMGVPALVFSTGGYTGNVYHEFNDGLIPLFITAQRFKGEVVMVVAEYHSWWLTKYRSVLKGLTNYKLLDLASDPRVHCFKEMIVGLKIHGELAVDPNLMPDGKGIQDFQKVLHQGFGGSSSSPQPRPTLLLPSGHSCNSSSTPKLAVFIRYKSRVLQNLKEILKACKHIGFQVQILNPRRTTPLSAIYASLNSSDAMLAVHGAAMTHFLFLRPSSVLIQIVPLGLDWAADSYYGEPARKLGLEYLAYKVAPEESSLSKVYGLRDPVIADPSVITDKGWSETKKVYLDNQNVKVNIRRFSRLLQKAHKHICTRPARV